MGLEPGYQRNRLLVRLPFLLDCPVSNSIATKVKDIDFRQSTINIIHLKSRLKLPFHYDWHT